MDNKLFMRAYMPWWSAKRRCENPTDPSFHNYGGRGIRMHWRTFQDFLSDMGHPPPGMTLDRIDNDGDYCPENCRWVDQKTNARNRRTNRLLTANGETRCIAEWSEITGIGERTLWMRLHRGWSDSEAINRPLHWRSASEDRKEEREE